MKFKLILLFLFSFHVLFAQHIDSIQRLLDSTYSSSPFFGNVLITKNNQVLFEKSYGYADATQKKLLTAENSF
jgi:hypothetical protein